MNYFLKKNLLAIVIAVIVLLVPFAYQSIKPLVAYNEDFKITNLKINATLNTSGDMKIVEEVTYDFNKTMHAIYKDIVYMKTHNFSDNKDVSSYKKNVKSDSIVKVYDEQNGYRSVVYNSSVDEYDKKGYQDEIAYMYRNSFTSGYDIDERGDKVTCDPSLGKYCESLFMYSKKGFSKRMTFSYEYTILKAATRYQDIGEINWIFVPNTNVKIENVDVTIQLWDEFLSSQLPNPPVAQDDLLVYGHGISDTNAQLTIDSNRIIRAKNFKQTYEEFTEIRVLFPVQILKDTTGKSNHYDQPKKALIVEQEKGNTLSGQNNFIYDIISWALFSILLLFVLYILYYVYSRYDKEHVSLFDGEYYRELPGNYPPAEMGYLYHFKEVEKDDMSATLMDLIRRKFIILDTKGESTTKKNPNYSMILNKEQNTDELTDYEKFMLDWFFTKIAKGDTLTLEQLEAYPSTEKNAIQYQNDNAKWVSLVKANGKKRNFFDLEAEKTRYRFGYVSGILVVSMIIFGFFYFGLNIYYSFYFMFAALALLIVTSSYFSHIYRRSEQGNEDYVRWKAFRNFLCNFSNFKDYPMPSIIIWEHYLVYAVSFGIADEVEKQLRLKFKPVELQTYYQNSVFGYNPMATFYMYHRISMVRNIASTTITTANAAKFKSGSGGIGGSGKGGFSGGSSFGGGGGGFRGR